MKLIFAVLLASLPALASDIRTIGGKKVDLQPIHDWKAAKAASSSDSKEAKALGERPLQHWKALTVVDYVKSLGDPVVVVQLAGGTTQTIMLRNCPAALLTKLIRRQSLVQQLKSAKVYASNAKANALEKEGKASASYSAVGSADFVNAVAADEQRRKDVAAEAAGNAKRAERNEASIKEEIATLGEEIASDGSLLAMATGLAYATFPIWDTGITVR